MTTIVGTAGNDRITPGSVTTGVEGGAPGPAADAIAAGAGDDSVAGGGGSDTLLGGKGDDTLAPGYAFVGPWGSPEPNVVDGGAGLDWVDYADALDNVQASLGGGGPSIDVLVGVENIHGSAHFDLLVGDGGGNAILGGGGEDTLDGGPGDDTLDGGADGDVLYGRAGDDVLSAGVLGPRPAPGDLLDGGEGNDTLNGGGLGDLLYGGEGDDSILGGPGGDVGWRGFNDLLDGGAGNDVLDAGDGPDSLLGGAGRDTLRGGAGGDALEGGDGDDRLNGGSGDDTLHGGAGADRLKGGAGADLFVFGGPPDGPDTVADFDPGRDALAVSAPGFGAVLAPGPLAAAGFAANATGTATLAAPQLAYDTDDGRLWWDADGTGAGAAVLLATLLGAPALTAADVVVLA